MFVKTNTNVQSEYAKLRNRMKARETALIKKYDKLMNKGIQSDEDLHMANMLREQIDYMNEHQWDTMAQFKKLSAERQYKSLLVIRDAYNNKRNTVDDMIARADKRVQGYRSALGLTEDEVSNRELYSFIINRNLAVGFWDDYHEYDTEFDEEGNYTAHAIQQMMKNKYDHKEGLKELEKYLNRKLGK